MILALDVGTTESAYCLVESKTYKPIDFGKIDNNELLEKVKTMGYSKLIYEEFQSYGMPIGESTIKSITWNGRYIQSALDRNIPVYPIYRREEKMNLCGSMRAKDSNIRQALIDRFAKHDFKNGKGTKNNKDWFYGFKLDVWAAYACGITFLDKQNEGDICDLNEQQR